ncbi:hypothetical protein GCM10007301_11980 [Azorhizobium oxalatiphilum]|uniref:Uncharacterized protein n=1 Tax=Azorhizobium oxalatiphilum TaxID=980631 RepID=A0A917BTQ1_9HYPH|nr:DUF2589 domain-containing protein [Azorhizobium oxalatiphilum]GGF54107.1 hypothetical protein GCM10007301_11980 [Azorhizobium oxalatiphilum]
MSDTQKPDSDVTLQAATSEVQATPGVALSDGELDAVSGGDAFSSLPFGNLVGGPLNAVNDANSKAANVTADFINKVGFKP